MRVTPASLRVNGIAMGVDMGTPRVLDPGVYDVSVDLSLFICGART